MWSLSLIFSVPFFFNAPQILKLFCNFEPGSERLKNVQAFWQSQTKMWRKAKSCAVWKANAEASRDFVWKQIAQENRRIPEARNKMWISMEISLQRQFPCSHCEGTLQRENWKIAEVLLAQNDTTFKSWNEISLMFLFYSKKKKQNEYLILTFDNYDCDFKFV